MMQVRLGGFGGQGIVLAGVLLGHAGVLDGHWVSGTNSYGAQARGTACRAEVILSDHPVDFPQILEPDVLVAMSQGAYDRFVQETKEDGLVIYDSQLVKPGDNTPLHRPIPATEAAIREIGNRQVANVVMLGAFTALAHAVSKESMETAVSQYVPPRFKEENLGALKRGFRLGQSSR